jgi:hypothetical protein
LNRRLTTRRFALSDTSESGSDEEPPTEHET